MPEVRVSHLFIVLVLAGALGFAALTFFGVVAGVGWFNTKNLKGVVDKSLAAGRGYPPAKTPTEAMQKFREAIQDRDYANAARYTTKGYKELLERAHPTASKLAATIDKIRTYGDNKGFTTDKTRYAFQTLDPFPKNFRIGVDPVLKGNDRAYGSFAWDAIEYKNLNVVSDTEWKNMDPRMFQNVLGGPIHHFQAGAPIELVKEEEHWKLNIPTNPKWEDDVTYFIERSKTYQANLDVFEGWMLNERFTSESYEAEILKQLRASK
jgi:hypothetical protein